MLKVPGITCILTYKDTPGKRFTMAGQTFPEPSPYDRLILDQRVRYVGDAVAIVAGEDEKAVNKAMKLIKVKYQKLPAILDFRESKDNEILIHPVPWVRITGEICVQVHRKHTEMWKESLRSVNMWWSIPITQRQTSRR